MKQQLLLLAMACSFTYAVQAQNADSEQNIPSPSDQAVTVKQVNASQFRKNTQAVQSGSCAPTTMCPQITTNTGNVRGYYFIAPTSFVICGLLVPTDASTGPQSIEVLRFHVTPPPAYPSVTNTFTSLFYVASDTGLVTPVSCNIPINAGDTIGIYGARSTSTICSYATPGCVTSILGYTVSLTRTGMQYPLYNQQMHDVWSETGSDISRIVMYVDTAASGINEAKVNTSISVRPNPSKGIFMLDVKNANTQSAQVEVYSMMGERVYAAPLHESMQIDLSAQAEGVYFVQVRTAAGLLTKKIIVSR